MAQTEFTKSEIFTGYNRARAAARKGNGGLDVARTNRALGYLLSGKAQEHWQEYGTTLRNCGCPDHQRKQIPCKGMIAKMIAHRINPQPQPQTQTMVIKALLRGYDPIGVVNSLNPQEIFERLVSGVTTPTGAMPGLHQATEWIMSQVENGWKATKSQLLQSQGGRSGGSGPAT